MTGVLLFETRQDVAEADQVRRGVGHALVVDPSAWVLIRGLVGFSIAGDFEQGMGRRMMLATSRRSSILLGYAIGAALRLIVVWVIITGVSLLAGMEVRGTS